MANKKISQLDRVSTHTADDLVPVVNSGFTQKSTLYDLDRFFLGDDCDNHIMVSGKLIAGCENTGQNGDYHNILGGRHNRIYGSYSTILGGENNYVQGEYNLAYGYNVNITSGNGQIVLADSLSNEVPGFGDATMTLNFTSGVHIRMGDLYVHEMMGKSAIQTNDKYLAYNVEEGIIYTVDTDLAAAGGGGGTTGPIGPPGSSGTAGTSGTSGTSGWSGTSGTSGSDGPPGPPGSDGAADLSALSPDQVIYVGGTEGSETFAGSNNFKFNTTSLYGVQLDQVSFKKAQAKSLNNNLVDLDIDYDEKLEVNARTSDYFLLDFDYAVTNHVFIDIQNLQDGQEFTLGVMASSNNTGIANLFWLYFDDVFCGDMTLTNSQTTLFLAKQKRKRQEVLQEFPTKVSGSYFYEFTFKKYNLSANKKVITWDYDVYGNQPATFNSPDNQNGVGSIASAAISDENTSIARNGGFQPTATDP